MKKYYLVIILIILVIGTLIGLFILNSNQSNVQSDQSKLQALTDSSKVSVKINNSTLKLEVARSEQKREEGLMNIKKMQDNSGMIFIFEDEQIRTFWMKNTYISIDIIFLDKDLKIVKIFENTKPLQTSEIYSSDYPSQFVIEANSGWVEKHNLKVSDKLEILRVQ